MEAKDLGTKEMKGVGVTPPVEVIDCSKVPRELKWGVGSHSYPRPVLKDFLRGDSL